MLRDRSRRLMGQLLRPHKRAIVWVLVAVLIENAARLAVPYLVKEGIDKGVPPILAGHGNSTLLMIVAIVLVVVVMTAPPRHR